MENWKKIPPSTLVENATKMPIVLPEGDNEVRVVGGRVTHVRKATLEYK